MSFFNDKTKFTVKTSNMSTVARFSSTLDDAYFLILAQNSNNYHFGCNNSAAVFGASSTSDFEAYIGIAKENLVHKIARFNNKDIYLNRNVIVTGNIVPASNLQYSLGNSNFKFKDLYLSGNTIYLGETVLSSDKESGTLTVKNSSNEIAPIISSKIKLLSTGTSSNYSVFTSTDYGINLTFYDKDDNVINHLDLGQADTSFLPEGSNLYYTFERFDERLLSKTLDDVRNGTSNRYIINDVYDSDLNITGSLFASNLVVYGDRTTFNTETYQTEQLEIFSDANGPVLTVRQYGNADVMQVYSQSNVALVVNNTGFVGINTSNPQYELDVNGVANATYFLGDGSQLFNVNFTDRSTDLLAEGSNLYYTSERVGIIATSSNIDTSNYIQNTSNDISARLTDTSNLISDRLTNTSNLISDRLTETSNLISDRLTETSNLISNRLSDTSNLISNRLTNILNAVSGRITDLTTDQITEGNNLFYTTERFDERLLTKTLDDINIGTSNRFIVNDVYNRDLNVTGTLSISNLIVHGSYTTLDTVTYQTKKLEIMSDSEAPALLVRQTGNSNIMEVYDDNNIVLSIVDGGFVGVNKAIPEYTLDVEGTLNTTYLRGSGSELFNVNLSDRNTSLLAEGSNLYYTSERVGIISTACNIDTSNYVTYTYDTLTNLVSVTSNIFANDLMHTSNIISERITNLTTENITEGTSLFYTEQRFDERLDTKTADYIKDGTSNKYIVNDMYHGDLTITGTLITSNLVVSGEISTLNTNTYQTERMEIVSDINGPALRITQKGVNDIMHVYDDTTVAFSIIQGGNVGINTITPEHNLDVLGTTRATYFVGEGSSLSNLNLADRDTSLLAEGSNLYYTAERVGVISLASNIDTSNYILETSNLLITKILETSNLLTDTINNVVSVEIDNTCNYLIYTSNLLIKNITDTSNTLTTELNDTINNEIASTIANLEYTCNVLMEMIVTTSNELTNLMNNVVAVQVNNSANNLTATSNELSTNILQTSNQLTNTINNVVSVQITNTCNFVVNTSNILTANLANYFSQLSTRINSLTTNNIPEGSSNLYYTDARFDSMLQSKSLDDIRDGTSNRYIVNDRYAGDLYVTGTLSTSNLIVNGATTTLNTTTYQSKKLEIVSDAIGPALKVQQNGIFDIMQVYDDTNIVMSIVNGGKVGINTLVPQQTLDVVGTTRATLFVGDGSTLTNVNLLDRSTNMLVEGSNQYYTSERVGVIATSSNINTSNYILTSSNVISNRVTNVSNILTANVVNTSNTLFNSIIQSSNLISFNMLTTSNNLMIALINTSNLAVNTSNEIMTNLINTYNLYTSNFLANSNLLSSNILATSNALASMIANTYLNTTTNISDTSNSLIGNSLSTSNDLILNTANTFLALTCNLMNVSNLFASNIPIVYRSLYDQLYNVSNIIATQINNTSNSLSISITNNSNVFTTRIIDTSNVISNRITDTSNLFSNRILDNYTYLSTSIELTSNALNAVFQQNSNDIYAYMAQTSNSLSKNIVYNSNVISDRITALNLDMIAVGTSNTYIVNNIYDANLTITGKLVVESLDVVDLGLLEMNETGEYINTDMKTYVARITSNVLVDAPAIILNAPNKFAEYDNRLSNYISTKQDTLTGAITSITNVDLLPNRIVVTNNSGKLVASTAYSSNLEYLASLNAPVQTQLNNLNISSSNIAISILDRLDLLNNSIGQGSGGTGNNLSVTNTVITSNLITYDPLMHLKFEDLSDSSKYASKNYVLMKPYSGYNNHTDDLLLWYKFNGNTNNHVNNMNSNLYLVNGIEQYSTTRINGISSALFNGYTSYTMGLYNNAIVPSGIRYVNDGSVAGVDGQGITVSFWMNVSSLFVGRQYIFSYSTANILNAECAIEAYINTSNLCLSISRGVNASVYTLPVPIITNTFYNVCWEITKAGSVTSNFVNGTSNLLDSLWYVHFNGLNYGVSGGILGFYPSANNYLYNTYGGQVSVYGSNFFNGMIDDFRVYKRPLIWSEINENTGMNYPNYENFVNELLLWYNFDGHLHNYDGNSNYSLNLSAGTLNYMPVNGATSSLYNVFLNGSTYFSMVQASSINFNTVSDIYPQGLTFSVVFNTNTVAGTQYLFSMTDTLNSTTPLRSIEVYLTTNQLNFGIRHNSTTTMQTVTLTNVSVVPYRYYTVTWVFVPSLGKVNTTASWFIYVNGVNVYTSEGDRFYPVSGIYSFNYVGSLYNTSYFTGFIDDVRVYRKSLNADEVGKVSARSVKYGSFLNHTNSLVSWFNFDNSYNNTMFDNTIPLMYLNFNDKKIIAYNDTDLYKFYNSSNVAGNVYGNLGQFRELGNIAGYSAANSYTLVSTSERYIFYVEQFDLINMLKFISSKGFMIHFAIKADKLLNMPIFYFGNATKGYIQLYIYCGCVYMIIGESAITNMHVFTDSNMNTGVWNIVDVVCKIVSGRISFEIYVNGARQSLFTRYQNALYSSNTLFEYMPSTFLYGFENTGIYVGSYNPRNNNVIYENPNEYNAGGVLTITYYSGNTKYYDYTGTGIKTAVNANSINILNLSPNSSTAFNDYINQANNNKYWAFRDSRYLGGDELTAGEYVLDNKHLELNNINTADISSVFIEIMGSFYVDEDSYYYFALDLQNEIACELVLSGVNNFGNTDELVVSSYYGGSINNPLNGINDVNVLQYPVKLNAGYYRLYVKILRKSYNTNKYMTAKYYKFSGYGGNRYSVLSKDVGYVKYSSLSLNIKNGMVGLGQELYINTSNIAPHVVAGNLNVVGDDYGVFALGSAFTSNLVALGTSNFYADVLTNILGSNWPVKQFSNIANVSVGSNHTLVLVNDGSVYSCGANDTGQLGLGIAMNSGVNKFLKQVKGVDGFGYITNIIQVSAGDLHSMFLKVDGSLYGCGLNRFGQLGLGNTTYAYNVLQQSSISDVIYVSAGVNTTLVVKNDASAWGCGRNDTGQLAQGVIFTLSSSFIPIMDVGYSNALVGVKEVQAGGSWSLFLKNNGTCYASGGASNLTSLYQVYSPVSCNYTITYTSNYEPSMTSNYTLFYSSNDPFYNISQISAKADMGSLLLTSNGEVFRSSSNILNDNKAITKVATTTVVTKVAQGKNLYFLGQDGEGYTSSSALFASGKNDYGQLGLNYVSSVSTNKLVLTSVKDVGGSVRGISGITQISAGYSYSLFLRGSDGAVFACGLNDYGQLGINSTTDQQVLRQVLGLNGSGFISGITQISTGYSHSLFLRGSDGAVFACGYNAYGQLGINSTLSQIVLRQVLGIDGSGFILGITQVSACEHHTLYIRGSDGAVFACGNNGFSQLGINSTLSQIVLKQVLGINGVGFISGITQVSAGQYNSFFLRGSDGIVFACGRNYYGQLGINSTTQQPVLKQVLGVDGVGFISGVTQISSGFNHSLFLRGSDGAVFGCGYGGDGQLGIYTYNGSTSVLKPVLGVDGIGFISGITQISAAKESHSLFIRGSDGAVFTCGHNIFGQLGINSTTSTNVLKQVLGVDGSGTISGITQVSGGGYAHSLFLRGSDGAVFACGTNNNGRLGIQIYETQQVLGENAIGYALGIKGASMNNTYALFLHSSGSVYSVGENGNGPLGINSFTNQQALRQMVGIEGSGFLSEITQVTTCLNFSLMLHSSGTVYGSGLPLLSGYGLNTLIPKTVSGINGIGTILGITQVSTGQYHSLFLRGSDGAVFACGRNVYGQLGINSITNQFVLIQVLGVNGSGNISGITQVSAGSEFSLYLRGSDGAVFACGYNANGQLGINSFTNQSVLKQVLGIDGSGNITGITQVSAGNAHSLFIRGSDGAVFACGWNAYGQLGINSTTQQQVLKQVLDMDGSGNISGITQVSAGNAHSLFLRGSDGTVFSCGRNDNGQLGINSLTNQSVLKQVLGLNGSGNISGITQVSAGSAHSLFIRGSDGAVFACGWNAYGQLGINSTTDQQVLKQVLGLNGSGFITNITQVSAGNGHSLFIRGSDATVFACGMNNYGQLGINSITSTSTLKQVSAVNGSGTIAGITQISAGWYHSLFLHSSGVAYGCSIQNYGYLGINASVPLQLSGLEGVGTVSGITQISGGYQYFLFLHNSGAVYASGDNQIGQLGINSTSRQYILKQVLGVNGVGFISGITQVSAGNDHSLFLRGSDGAVFACGYGGYGALGINDANTSYYVLKQVFGVNGSGFITGITQISAGNGHSLFLRGSDGTVFACGLNNSGQLGINSTTNQQVLKQVLGLNGSGFISGIRRVSAAQSISANQSHSVFVHSSGAVYGCGDNSNGQLSITNVASYLVLIPLRNSSAELSGITDVVAGYYATVFIQFLDFANLYGNTDTVGTYISKINQISAYNHFMLVDKNTFAFSTGTNTYGQLANNTNIDQTSLQYVVDGEGRFDARNIIKIVTFCSGNNSNLNSTEYTMFLSNEGSVFFSGEGGVHSANLPTTPYLTYISALSGSKIVDIACGGSDIDAYYNYTLFLSSTGNVMYTPNLSFVKDSTGANLSNIVKIACRKNNWLSYFVNKDGLVFQSIASYTDPNFLISPATNVIGLQGQGVMSNIRQVEAGLSYTIFLTRSGYVYSLGDNTYGQLGTGNNTSTTVPVYMAGLDGLDIIKDIVRISCGNYYTMLLTKDTRVLATGYNIGGILGIGTTANTNVLKQVLTIDGMQPLKNIKDISCGVANITNMIAAVLLLDRNNNIYVNGTSSASTGLLTLLNSIQNISRTINSVHAAGAWLFLNTLKYDNQLMYDSSNQFAFAVDQAYSTGFYINDSNYTLNIADVRMYTPDVMGTSNVIVNQLTKGIYEPSTNPAPNNIIYPYNTSFDFSTYSSGFASVSLNINTSNAYLYLQPNFYDFGASDTTINMWVKASDTGMKYPTRAYTSNDNFTSCTTSTFYNMDVWRCFDNNVNTSLNINTYTQIYGIGYNNVGQLGDNTTTNRTSGYVPTIVPATFNEIIILVAGTANTTGQPVHMLTDAGRAYGLYSAGLAIINPNFFNGEKITFIASGLSTYFITESGLLYAYGNNTYWQLGNGNNTTQSNPILIPASRWNGEKVTYVATGNYHTYIITEGGNVFTIGYNNNGQLGTGNTTNQTNWTQFTALSNVLRVYCAGDQTYIITRAGVLFSVGVRGNVPFLESSIPSNKTIIKVTFSPGNCAFALADDGTVYGYGNNPISMPNTTSAQTSFIEMTSPIWTGARLVDVVTAGDHTFYTTDRGLVYVVGNNNYNQLNNASLGSSKTPLLVTVGGSRINLVYGGLFTTGYNLVITYPSDSFVDLAGNKGEFIKFDIFDSVAINYAQISVLTPATTTSVTYAITMQVFGSMATNAVNNVNTFWEQICTYEGTISYSATPQTITIVPTSPPSAYRYYAVLINSRYNLNIVDVGVFVNSSASSRKTLFDAKIDEYNGLNITLQSSTVTASVTKAGITNSIATSHPNFYNKGVMYSLSYRYNTDPNDATWRVYTNGVLAKETTPMPYPETGNYSNINIGRLIVPENNLYYPFTGYLDDFRIYNKALSNAEVIGIYSADRFNVEGNTGNSNKYALVSSRETYVYNVNYNDLYSLMRNIDSNGFTIHFLFKADDIHNSALYYIGGRSSSRLLLKIVSGVLYILLGSDMSIVSKNRIAKNTWYTFDLMGNIMPNGVITIQLYLNGVIQPIYVNNALNTSHTMNYSNLLAPDNTLLYGMYMGANNVNNNIYRDAGEISSGAIFTNTYFSCNLIGLHMISSNVFPELVYRSAVNGADFSNMITKADMYYSYKISSNIISSAFNYDGSNYLYGMYITSNLNLSTNTFVLTELDSSIWLSEGYYYFVNAVQNDITAELYIGTEADKTVREFTNVANFYGASVNDDTNTIMHNTNMTTKLPIYIPDGYYKFHSKLYSRSGNIAKQLVHHRYIRLSSANDYYSLMSHVVEYQAYNALTEEVRGQAVGMQSDLYIPTVTSNYIMMKTGGSIDTSMLSWGTSTYVYDNGVISRGTTDGAGTSVVSTINMGHPDQSMLANWGFWTVNTGRSITPMILEFTGGTNYILRGIGRTRTPTATGLQTYTFDCQSGCNVFLSSNYRFGWRDGTTTATGSGNIVYDSTSPFSISGYSMTSPASITLNTLYSFASSLGTRAYSFKLEFATSNHQFADYVWASSNYIVENMSNYLISVSSNYSVPVTSNYSEMVTSNYDGGSSNYTVQYTSNYSVQATGINVVNGAVPIQTVATSNYVVPYVANYLLPQMVPDLNNRRLLKGVVNICNGASHTVVLKFDGSVYACGWNNHGQLGIGTLIGTNSFVPVLDVSTSNMAQLVNIRGIGCGMLWSHFIKSDGGVYGCGLNAYGNIGDNTVTQRSRIVRVVGVGGTGFLTDIRQVVGGFGDNSITLFLRSDGSVFGCGNNVYGTLGDNSVTQRNAPVQMLGVGGTGVLSSIKQIATNASTSVMLRNDGFVFACGGNAFGQIGDNTVTQRNTPVRVLGVAGLGFMNNIVQVAAHGDSMHTLFLRGDGVVYGCGFNGFGQLGRNSSNNLLHPMRVMSTDGIGTISGIVQVANNANTSYFLEYDGTLLSCGGGDLSITSNFGNYGQLGVGFSGSNIFLPIFVRNSANTGVITGVSQLAVGGITNMNVLMNNGNKELFKDTNFYITKTENEKPNVYIQDFRIFNTGAFTSNMIQIYGTGSASVLNTAYSRYSEITDANRWMKSKDYYLYQNGVLNRSIYYTEGNVGIGTSAPTASLEIYTADGNMNSIKTNNSIWAQTGVISSSDARIKKNIRDIDDVGALEQILKIEPKTYNYIDEKRGSATVYGFLAQQVREVVPHAVSVQSESIPNIYKDGHVQNRNIILVDDDLSGKVHLGCMIDVFDSTEKIRCEVLEVVNAGCMRVGYEFDGEKVFVYGTVVDDFHTLDKSYVYTLNVCATQDLYRQIKNNKNKLEEQEKRIEALMAKMNNDNVNDNANDNVNDNA